MPQMNVAENGVYIDVEGIRGEHGAGIPPYTVSVSDPDNTVDYDADARTLRPNGTLNTGTVVVTITDINSGFVTVKNLVIVAGKVN
jgi:hypothetical protein